MDSTIVELSNGTRFGGDDVVLMAGPCSVESREQILDIAHRLRASGATVLRGGAFKPRTSPYAFQGLGVKGLELLAEARAQTGLAIVTEADAHVILCERGIRSSPSPCASDRDGLDDPLRLIVVPSGHGVRGQACVDC
jgi:3-deoxy-D-arabino-heptulosonate 7-phosphate (DAHP) synthase